MAMADVIFEIGGKALISPSDGDSDTPVISIELEINRNDLDPVRTQNITSQTGKSRLRHCVFYHYGVLKHLHDGFRQDRFLRSMSIFADFPGCFTSSDKQLEKGDLCMSPTRKAHGEWNIYSYKLAGLGLKQVLTWTSLIFLNVH